MDDLLLRFKEEIAYDSFEFLSREYKYFQRNYSQSDKIKSEYMSILAYYYDKNSNESFYDSNQDFVIQEAIDDINSFIGQGEYDVASYCIVSLQLLMGMEVHLNSIVFSMINNSLLVKDFVDEDKYFGNNNSFNKWKGK